MKTTKIFSLILIMTLVSILLMGCTKIYIIKEENVFQRDSWQKFKEEIKSEYDFISEIDLYGHTIAQFIDYNINREFSLDEVEIIFEKTRNFLLKKETFPLFKEYHLERNKGTLAELYITFKEKNNEKNYYVFSSVSKDDGTNTNYDSFQTWYIRYDGVNEEYNQDNE